MLSLIRCGATLIAALMMAGTAEAASIGVCGGGGGSQSKTLSCPSGQHIIGLFQRRGLYVDRIGIRCATVGLANLTDVGAFQFAGGTGGSGSESHTCDGVRGITRILTKAGSYIDTLSLADCERRQGNGFNELKPKLIEFAGSSGGSSCSLQCAGNEGIHRIIVRYGSWIDSIEAFCRR